MNISKLFKNAILNLYKSKVYTADFAILKASDYADKNKLTAEDYEELLTYLANEQEKAMQEVAETIEEVQEVQEPVEEVQEVQEVQEETATEENIEATEVAE